MSLYGLDSTDTGQDEDALVYTEMSHGFGKRGKYFTCR